MSAAISPVTGRSYGVQRVCRIWAVPRSSFYHAANANRAPLPPARRGPAPPVGEASLLPAIKADLASSPFCGEGHRKVRARLRYGLGLQVGRNRVLRLMREHRLLSPYRRPPRPANDHDCQSARKRDPLSASKRDPFRSEVGKAGDVSLFG